MKENLLKTQLTKRQGSEPDPRPRRRKVASVFKDPYDTIPKKNSTKQIIIKLRTNLDFQRGDNRTLECGQLCIRGLHVMGYFSGAVTTGLLFPIIPIIPSEIKTFELLYQALESGGTKVTCCAPNLELLDLDLLDVDTLEFQPDWEERSDEDSRSEVVPGSDGDDEADDGIGGDERETVEEDTFGKDIAENDTFAKDTVEKETVEKERNTNTDGRGRRGRRMSRRQRGKLPMGAGEDDGNGDDMDLDQ